tara:strand:- start:957 stop:1805 length:849 start_codon:yes stop_codon:yes gene_type:complete
MTGVFTVHRGIFDHPLFDGEPYSRRDAWLWLVGNAVWKPAKVRLAGKIIPLERGQLAYSERFMAKAWGWSKSKVHRFLGQLKIEAMIDLKSDHETNQITICNYDNYQFTRTSERTSSEPASGPAADQQRTKEEEGNKERLDHTHTGTDVRAPKPRKAKPSKVPLPENWKPSDRAREIATELRIDVTDQESRFRDYLAANGVEYANYDSAFCNFVRNAPKFNGVRGPPRVGQQTSFQEIASTLGDRANATFENRHAGDSREGKTDSQFGFIEPSPGPVYRRAS